MLEEQDNKAAEDLFDIGNIFSKRKFGIPAPEEKELAAPVKEIEKETSADGGEEDEVVDSKADVEEDGKFSDDGVDYKKELEKANKTLKDTQRSFHEDRKKLSAYKKAVEKFKEDGILLDEEATLLLNHAHFENEDEDSKEKPVLDRYIDIWTKELEYMRKYSKDSEEIDQNIRAFDHLISTSYEKDRQEIMDELSQYENDEVQLTKKMLEIGAQYFHDIYSDIQSAGNIRNLKSSLNKKVAELEKKLAKTEERYDNLKKKYEDYDSTPPTNIRSGGANHDPQKQGATGFDVSKIFASRYKR